MKMIYLIILFLGMSFSIMHFVEATPDSQNTLNLVRDKESFHKDGVSIMLDKRMYAWTDKVYITIVAPGFNFNDDLVDVIGDTSQDPIKISTRGHHLDNYKLVETGPDTGIFRGAVTLTGFLHDVDGDGTNDTNPRTEGAGPTSGFLESTDFDFLTISFKHLEDESLQSYAFIMWNIAEAEWSKVIYSTFGTGVVRIIEPDMNLNPEAVDNFNVTVWSDSDTGGINLTVTETNEATGIFEGTVTFTTTQGSSGSRLHVQEGDAVTAKYEDNTLPEPYSKADEIAITAVTNIGTIVPPLERAPAGNLRAVDAFGNTISTITVDQQIQVEADIHNGQDKDQKFAYLVQIQDKNGVTVSLAWITGTLTPGQNFTPALSWIPSEVGDYKATAFVWESVNNPSALSPPVTTILSVG